MPDGRLPGSYGQSSHGVYIDDGTLSRMTSPLPGTAGAMEFVAGWDTSRKLFEAARLSQRRLPAEMRDQFGALFAPENVAITAGVLAAWGLSHWVGVGEVIDVILLVGGVAVLGWQSVIAAREIGAFARIAGAARTHSGLEEAAGHLAKAVAIIGVGTFIAVVMKYGRRLGTLARSATGGFWGLTIDEWLAILGNSKAPPLVRDRVGTALQFMNEHFPTMSAIDVRGRLKGIDFSQEVSVTLLPRGTELIGYGDSTKLGMYYTKVGTPINRIGVAEGSRQFMRLRLDSDAFALESRTSGIADTWTTGVKTQAGGGGIQYILPDAGGHLRLERIGL